MKNSTRIFTLITALAVGISAFAVSTLWVSPAWAKKKKKEEETPAPQSQTTTTTTSGAQLAQNRVNALSGDDRRQFDDLSPEQKSLILAGKVDIGFNEWMVKLALGEPFYGTEHHPIYQDYEQVWLYTKQESTNNVTEEQIIDPQTNWPTIHRKTSTKRCTVGDFFILYDRGVVDKIAPDPEKKIYGSCTIETSEAYLPIVNGKPVEPKKP